MTKTIGSLLLERLHHLGLHHIFGIPGDYILTLYKLIEESPIQHIGTTREDCAGFAADAYARIRGIGGICVTYCVGGLNIVNAVACAYAERSPVVVLSGSPGLAERVQTPFLHHMVRDLSTQREVFDRITVASVVLDDPLTAEREIDKALQALMRSKRPIYPEIPRDLVLAPLEVTSPLLLQETGDSSNPAALKEAVAEVRGILAASERPVILAGAEIYRFGLQDELTHLVEHMNVPLATTLLGKSVLREDHPAQPHLRGASRCPARTAGAGHGVGSCRRAGDGGVVVCGIDSSGPIRCTRGGPLGHLFVSEGCGRSRRTRPPH